MKPKSTLRSFLLIAGSTLLAASSLRAATFYWDANDVTAGQTDGAGGWFDTDHWWTGLANTTYSGTNSAVFGYSTAGGAVTLAGTTTVGSLAFNPFTGTYTLGSAGVGNTITLNNGITKNSGGVVTIVSPLSMGGTQTWTNNAPSNINIQAATTLNGDLTFGGVGSFDFSNTLAVIGGSGKLITNGAGHLVMSAGGTAPVHSFTGDIEVNGGSIGFQASAFLGGRNTKLTNGYLGGRFGSGFTWSGGLGTGANQIQITGGVSGLSGEGATGSTFQIGGALSTLKWGANGENGATGFFNPTALLLNGDARMNTNGIGTLNNAIDLNGSDRTFTSLHTNWAGANNTGFTINGAITNSAGTAAGLIRTGAGNLSLLAANTFDGATTINGGTLTLRTNGTIASTTALNLGGGTLRMVNTANTQRFADVAVTATAGGGITYENTSGAIVYTESVGAVTVSGGLLNLVQNTNQAGAGSQMLTLGISGSTNLTQSGTGSVAFSALTTGPQASGNKNMFVVFGAGTTTAGQIVGPWATVGTAANAQTDYAVYDSDYVVPAAITGSAETTWTADADPYTMDFSSAGTTLTSTRNIGALRIIGGTPLTSVDIATETITLTGHTFVDGNTVVFGSGAPGGLTAGTTYFVVSAAVDTFKVSATLAGAAVNLTSAGTSPTVVPSTAPTLALSTGNNLGTHGILNGSPYAISITPGTGGSVTLPTTSAGQLHVTTGSGAITISAPITDNTGALTLVKNGSAGSLILNGANTFTGGIGVNAGTLQIGTNGTANGANLNGGTYAGDIFIGAGANLDFQTNVDQTLSGVISGDGNLLKRYVGTLTLSGTNTYTGKTTLGAITNSGSPTLVVSSFNSVSNPVASSSLGRPTTVANGTIELGSNNSTPNPVLKYVGTGETTDRGVFFLFNSSATRTLDASNGSGLLKFTTPFTSNGTTTGNIALRGTGSGEIEGGLPFVFTGFTKSDGGTWTLGGPVGSTGSFSVSAGTLVATDPRALGAAIGSGVTNGPTIGGSGTLSLRNNSSVTFGVANTGYNINNSASGATINVDRVSGTGAATMTVGNLTTTSTAGTWGLNFTGANDVSLSAGTLNTPVSTVAAVHTITNNIAGAGSLTLASVFNRAATIASPNLVFAGTGTTIVTGAITQTQADMDLIKNDAGTLLLNGTNTYTGTTTVNAGTLGGSGTLAGVVTVADVANLSPGTSVGTLTFTGDLNISALAGAANAGLLNYELDLIASSDKIVVAGNLNIGTDLLRFSDFNFTALGGLQDGTYKLIDGGGITGSLDPTPANVTGAVGGGTGTLQINAIDNDIELVVTGIGGASPEIALDQGGNIANGGSKAFGTVTTGSNTSLIFTITNSGTAALNLSGTPLVAVSGTNAADFSVTSAPTTPVTSGGGTTMFTVQFAPGAAETRNAILTIANDDSDENPFTINVSGTGQTPYEAWAMGALFGDDANNDGVHNGLAFLLGASGPATAVTLPTVTYSSGNLVLSNFLSRNDASRGTATLSVQHSSDLGIGDPWVSVPVTDAGTPASGVTFSVTPGSPSNTVTATISVSESAAGRLFGRLKATP